jgi:hypothetical protein
LAILVEGESRPQPALQVVTAGLELVQPLPEAKDFWAVMAAVEVSEDGAGAAVDGLSAEAVPLGEWCDIAVAAEEDGGGAGEAVEQG